MTQASLPYLRESHAPSIINTSSTVAFRGSPDFVDYAASKAAVISYTRALSQNLAKDNIRVNAVAPGKIWTHWMEKCEKEEEKKKNLEKIRP